MNNKKNKLNTFQNLKLTAIYEEINYENQLLLKTNHHNIPDQHLKNPISNSLDNSSLSQTSSNSTNCSNSVITSIMTANTLGLINSQTDKFYTNNQFFNPANVSINNRSNFENSINNSNYHMNKPDHELSNEIKSTFSASSNKGKQNLKIMRKYLFYIYVYSLYEFVMQSSISLLKKKL